MKRPQLKEVHPLPGSQVLLRYASGETRLFDVVPFLDKGIFRELRDPRMFVTVRVSFGTIEWPNGADFCPEFLYKESVAAEAETSEQDRN